MTSTTTASHYRRLLRRPRYPGFVLTVGLSRTSGAMFNTAGVLLVLTRTHSAALAGLTAAATVVPGAITGPVLGAWMDIAVRRRVLVVIDQLLSAIALVAILALAGHAPGWTVPAVAVLYSLTRPFTTGSFFSALAELAGPELIDAASAIEATSLNVAVVVGPGLAGVLTALVGAASTVEVQIALTLVVAALVAINPAFEARPVEQAANLADAVRTGLTALARHPVLRATAVSSSLAAFGWGLMIVGFPLYAVHLLHARAASSGYLWAAIAGGSIIGTFIFGAPSIARAALSYLAIALSALLWPLGGSILAGVALITATGVLEGPAYAGSIALRQRAAPPAVRGQVMTTISSMTAAALSAGAALGGLVSSPRTLIWMLVAINLVAAGFLAWVWNTAGGERSHVRASAGVQ